MNKKKMIMVLTPQDAAQVSGASGIPPTLVFDGERVSIPAENYVARRPSGGNGSRNRQYPISYIHV